MFDRDLTSCNTAELWTLLLEEASATGTLVLVNNLLMEREVRRKWQRYRKGFAPDIRTLASWLEELALLSLPDDKLPGLLLLDEDRTLWLEQWLSAHPDPEFRRFAGPKSVTAISNIIGSLCRDDQRPGSLLDYLRKNAREYGDAASGRRFVLAELLEAYEKEMERKNWLDREQLIGKMPRVADGIMRYNKVVLFLPDELDVLQQKALKIIPDADNTPELVVIRFDDGDNNRNDDTGLFQCSVFLEQFHHPREELESAVRHILANMAQLAGMSHKTAQALKTEPMHKTQHVDMELHTPNVQLAQQKGNGSDVNPIKPGTRFDDYVILTGDLSLYESMVSSVVERFDFPLYTSRGISLISHPFIRRLLTYLKLEHNGFQIDDIFRVFADNRIVLPYLKDHDEQKPPNIRHFSQFCRAYNFRTLEEVSSGMKRVFDWLLDQIQFEDDEEREQKRKEALRRDQEFYIAVVRHLEAFRKRYKTPVQQNLTDWVVWSDSLLDLQKDLMSRDANEIRELMAVILQKIAGVQEKLGLGQKITRYDFFKLLELRLKETRERPDERPGGVLLTEIRHLPDVHDKIVFVLGLHEDGFPRTDRPDFLQFRYERALQAMTGRDGTELYELGRMQLRRILASEHPRFLSCPALVEQKRVMPSPLWLELSEQMRHHVKLVEGWPDDRKKWLMSDFDTGMAVASGRVRMGDGSLDPELAPKLAPELAPVPAPGSPNNLRRYQLAARVEQKRQDPGTMGRYDGVIGREMMEKWWALYSPEGRMSMSISRLDTFASSPQEYFYKYILRLQPLHEYQEDAESNIKGSLLHHILQDFYSVTQEEGVPVMPAENPEAAHLRMKAIRERLVEAYRYQIGNPDSPFPAILIKNLEQVTRWFVDMEMDGYPAITEGLEEVRPANFYPDSGFSMEHRWIFEKTLDGLTIDFRGMIDRIDLAPDRKSGVIYDYKSGRSGAKNYKDILEGRSFQLPVYAMFVREQNIPFFLAGYYKLPVNGKRKDVGISFALGSAELIREDKLNTKAGIRSKRMSQYKPTAEMDAFLAAIEKQRISWIVRAVRDGNFHVSLTGEPKWSDFRYISRYDEQIQHLRSNHERTVRQEHGMTNELNRYYLAVPFWGDHHE